MKQPGYLEAAKIPYLETVRIARSSQETREKPLGQEAAARFESRKDTVR